MLSGCSSAEQPGTSGLPSAASAGNSAVNLNVGDGPNGSSGGNGNGNGNGFSGVGCERKDR